MKKDGWLRFARGPMQRAVGVVVVVGGFEGPTCLCRGKVTIL
jgi:hypothetical protein